MSRYSESLSTLESKSWQCIRCNSTFKLETNLHQHEKFTHGIKCSRTIPCSVCGRKFMHEFCLADHLKNPGKRHRDDVPMCGTPADRSGWLLIKSTLNNGCAKLKSRLLREFIPDFEYKSAQAKCEAAFAMVTTLRLFLQQSNWNLNDYIANNLEPDEAFHEEVGEAINALYRELQEDMNSTSYSVKNLIKGGSIAKGTALKNNSDLDCVMVLNGIANAAELKDELPRIKDRLKRCLERRKHIQGVWDVSTITTTRFSLQFTMTDRSHRSVEVDLLPTFYADVGGKSARARLFDEMLSGPRDVWPYYSAALVELQRDFVKEEPANVKNLIRLVKRWNKEFIPKIEGEHKPSSYFLELLAINAWYRAGKPNPFNMAVAFAALLKMLINYNNINVAWNSYYYDKDLVRDKSPPRVIDPANPTRNLFSIIDIWPEVKRVAEMTIKMPLLRNVTVTSNWQ